MSIFPPLVFSDTVILLLRSYSCLSFSCCTPRCALPLCKVCAAGMFMLRGTFALYCNNGSKIWAGVFWTPKPSWKRQWAVLNNFWSVLHVLHDLFLGRVILPQVNLQGKLEGLNHSQSVLVLSSGSGWLEEGKCRSCATNKCRDVCACASKVSIQCAVKCQGSYSSCHAYLTQK